MSFFLFQLINSLTFAALLFLVASGFTLIFGLMRIVNLAHGALYLLGGYIAYAAIHLTGNFFLGIVCAVAILAIFGIFEQYLLKFARGVDLRQVLITLGLAVMINDLCLVIFGGETLSIPVPELFKNSLEVFDFTYPKYRLFVLFVGASVFVFLTLLMDKTKLGALIRAGVDDRETIEALGVDISRIFFDHFYDRYGLSGHCRSLGGRIFIALSDCRFGDSRV